MAKPLRLGLIHGFLGSHRDFTLLLAELQRDGRPCQVFAPDLFRPGPCSAAHDYIEWAQNFLIELERALGPEPVTLIGYSLGARLALHAYLAGPQRFGSLWLLACNPGIELSARPDRQQWEQHWAARFRSEPWDDVMAAWNDQETFQQTTPRVVPREGQLDRDLVADSLARWSLTRHQFTEADLRRLPATTQWWYGSRDTRFMKVHDALRSKKVPGTFRVVEGAGHRLPLDAAREIAQALIADAPAL